MSITYKPDSSAGPLSIERLHKNERMMGITFPKHYIQHLKQYNGGKPVQCYFDVPGNTKVVTHFLCLVDDYKTNDQHGDYDIGVAWSRIEGRLNDYLLPFACLAFGDYLCFDTENEKINPPVVVWDHELSEEDKPHTIWVAGNFSDFLNIVYE